MTSRWRMSSKVCITFTFAWITAFSQALFHISSLQRRFMGLGGLGFMLCEGYGFLSECT